MTCFYHQASIGIFKSLHFAWNTLYFYALKFHKNSPRKKITQYMPCPAIDRHTDYTNQKWHQITTAFTMWQIKKSITKMLPPVTTDCPLLLSRFTQFTHRHAWWRPIDTHCLQELRLLIDALISSSSSVVLLTVSWKSKNQVVLCDTDV